MKKTISLLVLFFGFIGSISAQELSTSAKSWELTFGVGTSSYFGEYSVDYFKFKNMWTFPAFELGIQKWVTPCFGIGIGFDANRYKGLYSPSDKYATFSKTDDSVFADKFRIAQGWYCNTSIKALLDLTNIIWKRNPERIYSLVLYAGGGICAPFNTEHKTVSATFDMGLNNKFRVSDSISIDLNLKGMLVGDDFNGICYSSTGNINNRSLDGVLTVTVGVSYRF